MRTVKSGSDGLPQVFDIPILTIARTIDGSGNTAVGFTCGIPHKLAVGDKVTISGVLDTASGLPLGFLTNEGGATPNQQGDTFTVFSVGSSILFSIYLIGAFNLPAGGVTTLPNAKARKRLSSDQFDPFALVYKNRLQVDDGIPDSSAYINDTAAHNAPAGVSWTELLALSNCVVNALTSSTISGFASGMAIPAGTRIRGAFTSITLTSGSLLASS
jgi:hypothetical protein